MLVQLNDVLVKDRGRKVMKNVAELAASMKQDGQLQEIVVRPPNGEKELASGKPWVLVAGGRRYAAAIMNGWQELRAHQLGDLPPWKQKALELEENIQREQMEFFEIAEMRLQIQELYKANNPQWEQKDTARLLGTSPSTVVRDIQLAQAIRQDPSLKKATSRKAALQQVELRDLHTARVKREVNLDLSGLHQRVVTQDARDFLRAIETGSVDLLFTDLPWGIDYYERAGDETISKYDDSDDTTKDLIVDIVPQMLRVTNTQGWIVVIMNWQNHLFLRQHMECCCVEHYEYRDSHPAQDSCRYLRAEEPSWLWYRRNSRNNPTHPTRHAQNQYELILVLNRGEGRIYTESRVGNVLEYDVDYSSRLHSMQKPAGLVEEVIRRLSLPGQLVVDCCYGSGAILRGAAHLGRDFKGCDLNPELRPNAIAYISEYFRGSVPAAPTSSSMPIDDTLNSEELEAELAAMNEEEE
jgi:ParB/RepB/Spo0J family partition protein